MRLVILFILLLGVNGFKLNMISNNKIENLNNIISSHSVNNNNMICRYVNGEMSNVELNKFIEGNLMLFREYSLCKFLKFLDEKEEAKNIIFKNINNSKRLGSNELDILRRNKFVLIYSRKGMVLGGLVSIKLGKGDVIVGYSLEDDDYLMLDFKKEESNTLIKNHLIKSVLKDESSYILIEYIIDKFMIFYLEKLRLGMLNYEIENSDFINLIDKFESCNMDVSISKLKNLDVNINIDKFSDNLLNRINLLLNKII